MRRRTFIQTLPLAAAGSAASRAEQRNGAVPKAAAAAAAPELAEISAGRRRAIHSP